MSEINCGSRKFAAQLADAFRLQAMFLGKDQEQGIIRQQVIEHAPDSEAGQAILEMDRKEREANERDRR